MAKKETKEELANKKAIEEQIQALKKAIEKLEEEKQNKLPKTVYNKLLSKLAKIVKGASTEKSYKKQVNVDFRIYFAACLDETDFKVYGYVDHVPFRNEDINIKDKYLRQNFPDAYQRQLEIEKELKEWQQEIKQACIKHGADLKEVMHDVEEVFDDIT